MLPSYLVNRNFLVFFSAYFTVIILTFDLHGLREISVWLTSLLILSIAVSYLFIERKVNRVAIYIIFLATFWVLYAFPPPPGMVSFEHHLKAIFEYILYVLAVTTVIVGLKKLDYIFKLVLYSFLFFFWLAVAVFILLILGVDVNGPKAFSSIYANRNVFATVAIMYLVFLVFIPKQYIINTVLKHRLKYIIFLVVMVLVTASTKALLGLMIVFIMNYFFRYGVAKASVLAPVVIILFSLVLVNSDLAIVDRLEKKIDAITNASVIDSNEYTNDSGKIRVLLILQSIDIIMDNPLKGVGVNNAQFYMDLPVLKDGRTVDSQNNITEMALNAGLVGFALYYLPLLFILYKLVFFQVRGAIDLKKLKYLVITLLVLKLSWDFGMKSYNEVSHVFLVVFCFYIYLTVFKKRRFCQS